MARRSDLSASSAPVVHAEDRYVVARVQQSGASTQRGISVRRTQILERDPDTAMMWGGEQGCMTRLFLQPAAQSQMLKGRDKFIIPPRAVGDTCFLDTSEPFIWPLDYAVDFVSFELPSEALAKWAEDRPAGQPLQPRFALGSGTTDPVLQAFGLALLPILKGEAKSTQFFIDHVIDGLTSYLFDASPLPQSATNGKLAPWQEKRAKELMNSRLGGDLSLDDLASACGLSVAHFSRAFRKSIGSTPHKWLMSRRIEAAQALLKDTEMSLAEIAAECGFSDQAHLSNVFSRMVGTPPGAFRRHWRSVTIKF